MNVNSHIIKTCLMKYYRFKRGFLCVDEIGFEPADVLVDTGTKIIEIEIKISKNDLWRGESIKRKHKYEDKKRTCNAFYLCVPTELIDEGKKWIFETNEKYGLIEFRSDQLIDGYKHWNNHLLFQKRAKSLNKNYNTKFKEKINMRICSALVNMYESVIK